MTVVISSEMTVVISSEVTVVISTERSEWRNLYHYGKIYKTTGNCSNEGDRYGSGLLSC